MPIKGPLWLLGESLKQERSKGKMRALSAQALNLGLLKKDATRGHLFQASGAVQKFLQKYPHHVVTIKASSHTKHYKPKGQMLKDWKKFFGAKTGAYEHPRNGYNFSTLRGLLTKKYGGTRTGGGGADNEFEIALRLFAEFL